jgi:DeoR family transcriptional regulator of aga operon
MRSILTLLQAQGGISLTSLSKQLGVSTATLRRDLANLHEQGLLIRTHGGARTLEINIEIPVRLRDSSFRRAKQLIGRRSAELVPSNPRAVAIGGGTTTLEVARALGNRLNLTIVTNSLTIALECVVKPNLRVIMTGGVVRQSSFEAVGPLAENIFKAVKVSAVILGADGVSASGGATTHDETEARTSQAMVENAQRVIVVADGSKIGLITLAKIVDASHIDDLVTDSDADPEALSKIAEAGVNVHVVDLDWSLGTAISS